MKHELCPPDCLFDPSDMRPGLKETCMGCQHSQDKLVEPYKDTIRGQEVTVIGTNGKRLYILEKGTVFLISK